MGYLGLSGDIEKEDNFFRRVFWPSDHAGEADSLGQQGFWICLLIGVASLITLLIQGHWIIGVFTFIFLALGSIGVREHSTAAAGLVAIAYVLNLVASAFMRIPPGILTIFAALLLLANIRGTRIAARWAKQGDPDAFPERMRETWQDRLVDQMPARVWPKTRILFFCMAGIYLLLSAVAVVAAIGVGLFHPIAPAS